jgi:hypothetical protein
VKSSASSNQSSKSFSSRSSSSSDNDTNYDGGSDFTSELFFIFEWTGKHQRDVLSRREDEPWLVSLEMFLSGAYFLQYNNIVVIPSAKLHWGMFSTDLRYFRMQDETGFFETLDWQVLQLNLINQKSVRLYGGIGFSHEYFTESFYPEYGLGIDIHINDRKINPMFMYRISKDYTTSVTPRKEISGEILTKIVRLRNIELLWDIGLIYQKYYSESEFYFIKTGLVIRTCRRN